MLRRCSGIFMHGYHYVSVFVVVPVVFEAVIRGVVEVLILIA